MSTVAGDFDNFKIDTVVETGIVKGWGPLTAENLITVLAERVPLSALPTKIERHTGKTTQHWTVEWVRTLYQSMPAGIYVEEN